MRTLLLYLFLVILTANIQTAFGVSAYPFPIEITQPDGTRITITLRGDEHLKWAQTTDGFSIMRNNKGIFEYTRLSTTFDMIPSGVQARNERERSGSDNQFLSHTPKGLTYSKNQVGMIKSISQMTQINRLKSASVTGTKKFICILIGFTDQAFTKTNADFENLFNQVGYATDGATGSVYDYYAENSYGQLNLSVTVAGPYTAAHNMAYYGANDASGNDINAQSLVNEAVTLADPSVNYADFDNDRDGSVDGVYVIHSGFGEEAGAPSNNIWAHNSAIPAVTMDEKIISNYACSAELRGVSGTGMIRIGAICHEFGHILGATDYYDTNYATDGSNSGTGSWDLMGDGSWNNSGATPAHHNPYNKIFTFGWATAKKVTAGANITMNDAERNGNSFYMISTATPNEFFLCENRQKQNFDSYIPGHGLVIYHVDGNFITTNGNKINSGSHQGMYPVCANATDLPPANYGIINSSGLPFPGSSNKTSFTDNTIPNAKSWASDLTGCPITGITENTILKTVSFSSPVLPGRPIAPIAYEATNRVKNGFSANWQPSAAASGYQLDISTNAEFTSFVAEWNKKDVGNVTSFRITALDSSSEYFYRVSAYNTGGTSDNSNTIALKTTSALLADPIGLTVVSCNDLVTLKWTSQNDPNFLRYIIYGGTINNPLAKIDSTQTNSADTVQVISGLTHGLEYNFRVTAIKDDGSEISLSNLATTWVKKGMIPVIKQQSGSELICSSPGDSIQSYQWFKSNSAIPDAVQPYCKANNLPGAYYVETIYRDGCINSSNPISTLGISSLTIYPNPVRVSFSLKINAEVQDDAVVSITSSTGIKVMEFKVNNTNQELLNDISVENLKAGFYIVRATLNQKDSYSTKMMVIK